MTLRIVPGDPKASSLIKAVRWMDEKLQKKKLSGAQITDLTHWIKIGAQDSRTTQKAAAAVLAKASEH